MSCCPWKTGTENNGASYSTEEMITNLHRREEPSEVAIPSRHTADLQELAAWRDTWL